MSANLKASSSARLGEDRVAAALRENLRKRKLQEQTRAMKNKTDKDKDKCR